MPPTGVPTVIRPASGRAGGVVAAARVTLAPSVGGALALRDQQRKMKDGYSIVTTADGPRGPQHEFKSGTVLMARVAGVPIVPIGCAADRAWYLEKRWDRFMIPKPFARIVIAVGEPVPVPREIALDELEPVRLNVQQRVMSLMKESEHALEAS